MKTLNSKVSALKKIIGKNKKLIPIAMTIYDSDIVDEGEFNKILKKICMSLVELKNKDELEKFDKFKEIVTEIRRTSVIDKDFLVKNKTEIRKLLENEETREYYEKLFNFYLAR